MARSYEQIMKDIETIKATPAFQKKIAAWQKEIEKQKKAEAAKAEATKPKTKPKSPTTRATSKAPTVRTPRTTGGGGMRGGLGSFGSGGGLRGNVNK